MNNLYLHDFIYIFCQGIYCLPPPHQKSINGVFVNFPVLELSVSFLCALEGNVFHVLLCSSQYICTESIMVVLCDIK